MKLTTNNTNHEGQTVQLGEGVSIRPRSTDDAASASTVIRVALSRAIHTARILPLSHLAFVANLTESNRATS